MRGKRRCNYIIKTNLKEMSVHWSHLMQYRDQWRTHVNMPVNLLVPSKRKSIDRKTTISFSRIIPP